MRWDSLRRETGLSEGFVWVRATFLRRGDRCWLTALAESSEQVVAELHEVGLKDVTLDALEFVEMRRCPWPTEHSRLLGVLNGSLTKLCVCCGHCCRTGPCYYGEWDSDRHRCAFLTEDDLCSLFREFQHEAGELAMMGCGCSSTLFNTRRDEIVEAIAARCGKS